ncbi:hypothetical protein GCM10009623_29710 [Nocardioides aestuarii]|uniref:Calcium-binding protein n=1 Tax=Nocardioides aestuarii TaxID=252231 RepID=A0ABW4TQY4_9ACTN
MRAHRWVPPALLVALTCPLLAAAAPSGGAAVPRCDGVAATIVGTTGPDRLTGTSGRDVGVGLGGDDVIDTLGGDDLVCGGPGADRLVGGPGDDRLLGGSDRKGIGPGGTFLVGDTLLGGPGADRLVGGGDTRTVDERRRPDTYSFADSAKPVTVDLSGSGDGTARGQGRDTIAVGPASGVVGTAYADTVTGSRRADTVDGGGGNDTIATGLGPDTVFPDGMGAGDGGRDTVATGPGRDFVSSVAGRDQISTGADADFVEAFGPDPTVVDAGSGDDYVGTYVAPGQGASLAGGAGDDTVAFYGRLLAGQTPTARFTVDAGRGTTSASGAVSAEGTIQGVERHRFVGPLRWKYVGSDLPERTWAIEGGPLRALMGGGNDVVTGSPLDDLIDGGSGTDTGYGGGGDDTCRSVERGGC